MAEMNGRSAPLRAAWAGRVGGTVAGSLAQRYAQEEARARSEMSLHQAIARRELANQVAAAQPPELSAPVLDQGPGSALLVSSSKGAFVIAGLTIGFGLLLGAAVMASSNADADSQKRE